MAQAAAIVINDGQATPVATTFTPESVTPALSTFADRSSGVSMAFRRLSVSNSFSSNGDKSNRSRLKFALPVTALVNGQTTLISTLRADVALILPDGCTDAQRKDLYAFVQNGLADSLIQGAMRDLDPLY